MIEHTIEVSRFGGFGPWQVECSCGSGWLGFSTHSDAAARGELHCRAAATAQSSTVSKEN